MTARVGSYGNATNAAKSGEGERGETYVTGRPVLHGRLHLLSMRHDDTRSLSPLSLFPSLSSTRPLSISQPLPYTRSRTRGFSSGLEGSPIAAPISRGTIRMPLNGDPRKSTTLYTGFRHRARITSGMRIERDPAAASSARSFRVCRLYIASICRV